jgi:hypothetical protein
MLYRSWHERCFRRKTRDEINGDTEPLRNTEIDCQEILNEEARHEEHANQEAVRADHEANEM